MVLSLTLVSLVAAALLGGMYVLTEEPIAQTEQKKQMQAKIDVLPPTENISFGDKQEIDGVTVYEAFAGNERVGAAVETFDANGFNGKFTLMVGFDNDGNITGYTVLKQNETPGLGANMINWFKTDKGNQNVIGLNPAEKNMTVKKDGGDIDAITAATITSRAFLRAIVRAYNALPKEVIEDISLATDSVAIIVEQEIAEENE